MPLFGTSFSPPSAVTGLNLEIIEAESLMRLTWDETAIAPEDFAGYRVYASLDGGTTFSLLALLTLTTEVQLDYYLAPLNTTVIFEVTQSNVDFESDPESVSGSIEDQAWWSVVPGDETLTFRIAKIRGADLVSPKVQDVYAPIGRETRVVVGDVVQTEEGVLSFLVMPDNPGMVALVKAAQAHMEGGIILKAPDGVNHTVQFGSMTRRFTKVAGLQELSLPFVGV